MLGDAHLMFEVEKIELGLTKLKKTWMNKNLHSLVFESNGYIAVSFEGLP